MIKIKLNNSEVLVIDSEDKKMTWFEAQAMCDNINSGYRLPTRSELNLMYSKLHLMGLANFSETECYWSSEDQGMAANLKNDYGWVLNFKNGESNLIELKSKRSLVRLVKQKLETVEDILQEWTETPNHLFSKKYHKHSIQIANNEDVFVISILGAINYNSCLHNITVTKLFPTFSNTNREYVQTDINNLHKLIDWMEQNYILQLNDLLLNTEQ
jgi:hypothetical protein